MSESDAKLHLADEIAEDDDGWFFPRCTCGWWAGPMPDRETAIDALMEHAQLVAKLREGTG